MMPNIEQMTSNFKQFNWGKIPGIKQVLTLGLVGRLPPGHLRKPAAWELLSEEVSVCHLGGSSYFAAQEDM